MTGKRSIFIYFILLFLNLTDLFPQAASISGWRHADRVYCLTEGGDSLVGASPSGKPFYFNGVSYIVSNVLVRTADGRAIFYPNRAGVGTHTIIYGTIGSHDVTVTVTVQNTPPVTLSAFSNVCSTAPAFSLFNADSSNVSPKTGIFSGPGVNASGIFNPAAAGPGVHTITYTAGVGSCQTSVTRTLTVLAAPATVINAFPPVCEDTDPFLLTQGFPAGGIYAGPGVNGAGIFDQSVTGIGSFPITYTYTNGTCTNTATRNIIVASKPTASLAGLGMQYCTDDGPVNISGNPAGVTGSFTGNGITDNGNGTAVFQPALSGLGAHDISYIFISPEGCADTAVQQVQVGTNVIINGLAARYCINSTDVTISATPAGGTFAAVPGLTDHGNATATFSPSTAGTGVHNISYSYIDGNGCINTRTVQTTVYALPAPSILNLAAAYCANNPALTIRGNYAPSGTFSGPATTDNGNGTAIFNPATLLPGNTYTITYTYQDALSGCQASVNGQVVINALPSAVISRNDQICYGDAATLSVALTGSGPFTFSFTDGSGTYTINNVAGPVHLTQVFPTDTLTYTLSGVTDSKGCQVTGSGTATIDVLPETAILSHPVSQNACPGSNIQFRVTATGVNLSYQWERNGIAIAGATGSVIALNNVQPADIGAYRCIITGDCGVAVTSNEAILNLWSPVVLVTDPSDVYECEGSNGDLRVQATGSNLVYQWYKNNNPLAEAAGYTGTNTANLFLSPLTAGHAGNYHVRITGSCGIVTSNQAVVEVDRNIMITAQPQPVQICEGFNAVFTVAATGDHLSYQWQLNNADLPGENTNVLTVQNCAAPDQGFYRCVVRSGCGSEITSNAASLTVIDAPVITANPVSLLRCEGDNAVFNVTATGSALSWQWKKNGSALTDNARISGSQTAALIITDVSGSDIGDYTCTVSNTCDVVTSAPASLMADTSLAIVTQPVSIHECLNRNVFFSIAATGNNLTYQWFRNGIPLPGKTNQVLVINNIIPADAGSYTCKVSNTCGRTINSNPATLTIDEAAAITLSPVDLQVCEGTNASFTVQATGDGLQYQWEYNGVAINDNGNITGTGSASLLITDVSDAEEGVYNCLVEGMCGSERSEPAGLLVTDTLIISEQPSNAIVCDGNTAQFRVVADGVTRYQWQKDEIDIPGENGATLVIDNVSATDSGVYRCVLESACGNLSTDGASLLVKTYPQVTIQPVAVTSCEDLRVKFESAATGSDLSWQWFRDGVIVNEGNGITGTLDPVLIIENLNTTHAGVYAATITGYCGNISTHTALLTVNDNPVITGQPAATAACENQQVSFTVTLQGNGSFQWQKDNADLPGKTGNTLTLTAISAADAGTYRCRITGPCGDIYSGGALLTVNLNPVISRQPAGDVTCEGNQVNLEVIASGTGLTWQWKQNGADLTDHGVLSGSTSPSLVIGAANLSHTGLYNCVITGVCGTITSSTAAVEIAEKITILSQPSPVTRCIGLNAAFEVQASGTSLTYQWQKDGVNIAGATGTVYSTGPVSLADTGVYQCVISGSCGQIVSDGANLKVDIPPAITVQPPAVLVLCEGNTLSAGFTADGSGLAYQWYHNGQAITDGPEIAGSQRPWLTIDPVAEPDEGLYYCEISNTCTHTVTNGMLVSVNKPALINIQPRNTEVCTGDDIVLQTEVTGDNLSYQWQKNNVSIAGATHPVYEINHAALDDSGSYQCIITSSCGDIVSAAARVTVYEKVTLTVAPPAFVSQCEGTVLLLQASTSGKVVSWQWKKNDVPLADNARITGSASPSLRIASVTPADEGIYTCVINGNCNAIETALTTVDVKTAPAVVFQPADYAVLAGGNASFTVTVTGDAPVYQWYYNGNPLANGAGISGAAAATLTITGVQAANEGVYNVVVTGSCGTISSQQALLTLLTASVITSQPAGTTKCEGESATMSITTSGTGHNYQWKKNGLLLADNARISGSQQAELLIADLNASDAGSYSCLVDGVENSIPALLYVNRTTRITFMTGDNQLCSDESILMVIGATGDSLSYGWEKDGIPLSDNATVSGTATPALSIDPVTLAQSGSYVCLVNGACGTETSDPMDITISEPVVITENPSDTIICSGQSAVLRVEASGTGLSWQWYRNGSLITDNARLSGTTTHTLIISDAGASEQGIYHCIIRGTCNNAISRSALITVNRTVSITNQPENLSKCMDDLAVFSINTSIPGVSYQWQKNGTDLSDNAVISGSDSHMLSISNLQPGDNGIYQCKVTGACNSLLSNAVMLDVRDPVAITAQPTGNIICEGASYTFSVSATGSALTYQWVKDGVTISDNGTFSGTQSPALVIDSASANESGVYHCIINGVCGSLSSTHATLTVNEQAIITLQPQNSRVCQGNDLSLSVFATGSQVTYEWQKDNIALADNAIYSGTASPVLHISKATAAQNGIYRCVVRGACNNEISNTAEVVVQLPPVITLQPADTTVCEGTNLLVKTAATGTDLTFNWQMNGVSRGQSAELYIENINTTHDGAYTCMISNLCGSVNTEPYRVIVSQHAAITTQPANTSQCQGNQVSFFVNVLGNEVVYQWEFNGVPVADNIRIAGSNTRSLVISAITAADEGTYRCVITDGCGTILNSDPAILTVYKPAAIMSVPAGDTICAGQSVTLTVNINGSNPVYSWFRNGILLNDGQGISGSNTASLNLVNAQGSMSGYYTFEAVTSCGTLRTSPIPVIVGEPVTIAGHPGNLNLCAGENAVFSVQANGDSLQYQWMLDGNPMADGAGISGTRSSVLVVTGVMSASAGSYHCVVSNACGSVNSQPAALIVHNYPETAGAITGETIVCQGSEGLIYSVAAIPGADSYKWTLPAGMTVISGHGTRQIEVAFDRNESGGVVFVQGINACGSGEASPALNVTVNPLPSVYAGENRGVCSSETMLTSSEQGLPATGIWQSINGPAVIDQPDQPITRVSSLRNGINRFARTVTLNGCTLSDTVIINNNMQLVEAGSDTSICSHVYTLDAEAPTAGTGKWSIVSGAGYNIDRYNPSTRVSGLAKGTNIFKWSVTLNGCVSYDTVMITNNLPTEADAGPDQNLQTDNTVLGANNPAIGTGSWALLNGAGVIKFPTVNNSPVTGLGQGKNILEWTITFNGCVSSDTVVISNTITDSTDAGPNQIICSNSVRLNAKNPYPGYGEWSVKRGSATFSNNSLYNTYAYNLAKGENVLVWTQYLNGVTSDSVIIINDLPTSANAGVSATVCFDSAKLNANLPYVGSGVWTVINGAGTFENDSSNSTWVRDLARGRNSLKWTITNGNCTSSSVVSVTNNRPTDAEAGFDATICEDTISLNPNVPTFGIGEWSVASGSAKFRGNIAYDLGKDGNYLVYSIRNNGCYSRDTLVITSHKPTIARLGPDQSVCIDSLAINGNSPVIGSGVWSLQSGSALIDNLHAPVTVAKNLGAGENVFRWTITYMGCSSFDDMIISNDYIRADAGEDQVLCSNRTILEGNDAGYSSGSWTVIGGSTGASIINPHAPNSIVENLSRGINILRWTISKNACVSYDEVTLINNNPTAAFAGENAFLCMDQAQLRANPVSIGTGTWTVLSGSGTLADEHNPFTTVSSLATGINVLRWTTENAGCYSTDEVIISNNLPVNVYAGLDQSLCDDSTLLYANPPVIGTGTWSVMHGSASFDEPGQYNSAVLQLGNGPNQLKWTVSTTGCSVSDTVTITNNLPTRAVAGSDFPVCNSIGSLNANTPLYGTGTWSLISGSGSITDPSSPRTVVNDLALGNNTLQWTITNVNCQSTDQLIIVNNSPTIADAGESAEVCGETAILYANSPVVGNGYWSVTSGTGSFADSLNYNTTISGLNFGDNTLRWTTQNGACLTFDEITVTNNLAYIYAGEDQVVYEPRAVLAGNNPGIGSGSWLLTAGAGNFENPGNFSTAVEQLGAGLNTFEWTITNGSCTARDQVVINFKIMPQAGFTLSETEGCPGITIDFINTTRYGTTYRWDLGDGTVTSEVNPSHTYSFADNFIVRLTAFGPDNRNVVADTLITIHTKPIADFLYAPDTAFVNKPVRFYNRSLAGASEYSWDFGDNEYALEENPLHYYRNSGAFDITLTVSSAFGCTDTLVQTIMVAEDGILIFPNAFTPNTEGPNGGAYHENDFSNDVFHPYHENVDEFHLEIYSRWGVLLFESDDINTGWDGYYKGVLLSRDVYVWKATGKYVSGSEFLKTGNVLLIRQ